MSFVWHFLDKIYAGAAPMFIFHISMLYFAAAILIYIFKNSVFKWWYAIYPLLPNILAYTALIVKDTGFTFAYLLSASIMALLCMQNIKRWRTSILSIVILLLFYGTAVKFQAKYLLVFFTIGVSYCACNYKFTVKSILAGIALYIIILTTIVAVNAKLVPSAREAHSWQWVKVYDLSAISLKMQQPLYPDFILQQPNFSFTKIQEIFEPQEVDLLVFGEDAVIHGGVDGQQRQELWNYWFKTILQHPFLYLTIRLNLFKYNLITAPCDRNNPVKFLKTTSLASVLDIPGVTRAVDAGYMMFKIGLRFIWLMPLLLFYTYLGIKNLSTQRAAAPILLLSLASITLLLVLLFCSMAGTARYVFLCTCLVHAGHGFAYLLYSRQTARTRQEIPATAPP